MSNKFDYMMFFYLLYVPLNNNFIFLNVYYVVKIYIKNIIHNKSKRFRYTRLYGLIKLLFCTHCKLHLIQINQTLLFNLIN